VAIISIVEDDPGIRNALVRALGQRGHAVTSTATGMEGLQQAVDRRPDIVVLDLGLPDVDGEQVLTMLRAVSDVPVVVVTARDDDDAVVRALNSGADDYVVKPFDADQLEARIRAVLRRSGGSAPEGPIRVGDLVIDPTGREVSLRGDRVELSRKEFDLLHLLARRLGEVVPKREILAEVWHEAYGGSDRTVDVHVSWLRRKLGETAAEPVYVHSIRGVGLRLVDPTRDAPC
jgi:DNA-binding response OmpR family regulator